MKHDKMIESTEINETVIRRSLVLVKSQSGHLEKWWSENGKGGGAYHHAGMN